MKGNSLPARSPARRTHNIIWLKGQSIPQRQCCTHDTLAVKGQNVQVMDPRAQFGGKGEGKDKDRRGRHRGREGTSRGAKEWDRDRVKPT